MYPEYEKEVYRKLKWHAFVNRRRSEDRMVNNFRKKFGKAEDIVIGWGDWSQGEGQMKFLEPTKGIGMRKIFRRVGYTVLLVNEFRTSCRCYGCGGECAKFRMVENPRFWKRNERPMVLRNGLISCKNCVRLWNRDRNGSLNILCCAKEDLLGRERPDYLQRKLSATRSVDTTQGESLPTPDI